MMKHENKLKGRIYADLSCSNQPTYNSSDRILAKCDKDGDISLFLADNIYLSFSLEDGETIARTIFAVIDQANYRCCQYGTPGCADPEEHAVCEF